MNDALIEALPKAELHLHIEGAFEPTDVLAFARRNGLYFPHSSVEALMETYEFSCLSDFVEAYMLNSRALMTERDFYELTYAYMRRARADNILHVEPAMAPQAVRARGLSVEMAVGAVLAGIEYGKRDFGMTGGLIIGCQRHRGAAEGMEMLDWVAPFRDRVLALGLAGLEVGHPPHLFRDHFERARDMGWKTVAHAGEEGPPDYVWQAIHILKVDRIDHGVRCIEDPELVRELVERQIPLTICPLSNIYLKVFPSLDRHSLAALLRAGVCVTVNSDDPPYFGGYMNENFRQTAQALALGASEIVALARNSVIASFAGEHTKTELLAKIDRAAAKVSLQ